MTDIKPNDEQVEAARKFFEEEFCWDDGDEWIGVGHSAVGGAKWRIIKDRNAMTDAIASLIAKREAAKDAEIARLKEMEQLAVDAGIRVEAEIARLKEELSWQEEIVLQRNQLEQEIAELRPKLDAAEEKIHKLRVALMKMLTLDNLSGPEEWAAIIAPARAALTETEKL